MPSSDVLGKDRDEAVSEFVRLREALARLDHPRVKAVAATLDSLEARSRKQRAELDDIRSGRALLRIAVVGTFSAGKSSLLNHLFGHDLCPTSVCPTTSSVTRFVWGEETEILNCDGGRTVPITAENYAASVQHDRGTGVNGKAYVFEYRVPVDLLRGVQLVDTPGFDNPRNPHDNGITEQEMRLADAILYVTDMSRGDVDRLAVAILDQLSADRPEAPVYLLLSKADLKPSVESRRRIADKARSDHDRRFRQVLTYSTKKEGLPLVDDRESLRALFSALQRDKVQILEQRLGLKQRALLRELRAKLVELKQVIGDVVAETTEDLAVWGERLSARVAEAVKSSDTRLESETRAVARKIVGNCLEVDEVPDTGIFGVFLRDGMIVADFARAKSEVQASEMWRLLESAVNRLCDLCADPSGRQGKQPRRSSDLRPVRADCIEALVDELQVMVSKRYNLRSDAEEQLNLLMEGDGGFPRLQQSLLKPLRQFVHKTAGDLKEQATTASDALESQLVEMESVVRAVADLVEKLP